MGEAIDRSRRLSVGFLFMTTLLVLLSCIAHHEENTGELYESSEMVSDHRIPRQVWDAIEAQAKMASEGTKVHSDPTFEFVSPIFTFSEVLPGTLVRPRVRVEFPRGGGVLDTSDILGSKKGSFTLKVALPDVSPEELKVYYVSQVPKTESIGDELGSGCYRAMDISRAIKEWNSHDGLKLNSTDSRHLRVIGGDLILMAIKGNKTLLGHVSLLERDQQQLFCKGFL